MLQGRRASLGEAVVKAGWSQLLGASEAKGSGVAGGQRRLLLLPSRSTPQLSPSARREERSSQTESLLSHLLSICPSRERLPTLTLDRVTETLSIMETLRAPGHRTGLVFQGGSRSPQPWKKS